MVNCVAFVSKFEKYVFLPWVLKDGWMNEFTEPMNEWMRVCTK